MAREEQLAQPTSMPRSSRTQAHHLEHQEHQEHPHLLGLRDTDHRLQGPQALDSRRLLAWAVLVLRLEASKAGADSKVDGGNKVDGALNKDMVVAMVAGVTEAGNSKGTVLVAMVAVATAMVAGVKGNKAVGTKGKGSKLVGVLNHLPQGRLHLLRVPLPAHLRPGLQERVILHQRAADAFSITGGKHSKAWC